MHSTSNLDLLRGRKLDLVICLNPLSSTPSELKPRWPHERVLSNLRAAGHRRLRAAAARLEREGTQVILVEPTAEDLAVMGHNLMSRKRRHDVIVNAIRTVSAQLQPHRKALAGLPPGDPDKIRRPKAPPAQWRRFTEAVAP